MSVLDDEGELQGIHRKAYNEASSRKKHRNNPKAAVAAEEKKEEQRKDEQHPEMIGFDLPFRALLLGQTGAGKTFAFVNQMLLDPRVLRHKFRKIICFSPTMEMDPVWQKIFTEDKNFVLYKDYDDEIMHRIFLEQRHIHKECRDLAEPILIFIDDNSYTTRQAKNHVWLDKTFVSGRHIDISVIILAQKMHMISPVQREQLSNMLMWCTASQKSLEASHEQMGAMLDRKDFYMHFCNITSKPYAYMHCRKAKEGGVMQIWDGLEICVVENVNSQSALQRAAKLNLQGQSYQNQQGPQNPASVTLRTPGQ